MRFAITGSTGFIGSAVTRELRAQGHHVTRVVRSYGDLAHGERAVVWHPDEGAIEARGLEQHDVVIHLAGDSIAGVWTQRKKRRIRESRMLGTSLLADTIARLEQKPRVLLSASAVGIYGDRGADVMDESSAIGTGFLAEVVRSWEAATKPAKDAGIRVVNMRLGNVLGRGGGLLQPLLPLFRLGLGARIGDGTQYFSWIAREDITPAMLHVLERPDMSGPVNFAAPQPVTNATFTNTLAALVRRPSFLKLPKAAARLAPGGMGDDLLLSSTRAVPKRLLESGYAFRRPTLRSALEALV